MAQNTISSGVNEFTGDLAGRTIGWVRNNLRAALNIAEAAVPKIEGVSLTDDHVLTEGEDVDFVQEARAKGRAS